MTANAYFIALHMEAPQVNYRGTGTQGGRMSLLDIGFRVTLQSLFSRCHLNALSATFVLGSCSAPQRESRPNSVLPFPCNVLPTSGPTR
jgi:hypothetical protein